VLSVVPGQALERVPLNEEKALVLAMGTHTRLAKRDENKNASCIYMLAEEPAESKYAKNRSTRQVRAPPAWLKSGWLPRWRCGVGLGAGLTMGVLWRRSCCSRSCGIAGWTARSIGRS